MLLKMTISFLFFFVFFFNWCENDGLLTYNDVLGKKDDGDKF